MKNAPAQSLRNYARIPFDADVLLHAHGQTMAVQLVDIALKGALVQTGAASTLNLDDPCRLLLPLADNGEGLVMAGRVVHINDQHVGIECLDIDVTSLTRLRRLVELNTGDSALMDRELSHLFAMA